MNLRFIGKATNTPRNESTTLNSSICHHNITWFCTHMYAVMPEISGPVMYPAEVAIDCMALFSRMVMSFAPSPERTLNIANARMTEVSPTPSVQPVLAPTYRFVALSNPPSTNPVIAARTVNCAMSPRKTVVSHQRSFCSRVQVRICSSERWGIAMQGKS